MLGNTRVSQEREQTVMKVDREKRVGAASVVADTGVGQEKNTDRDEGRYRKCGWKHDSRSRKRTERRGKMQKVFREIRGKVKKRTQIETRTGTESVVRNTRVGLERGPRDEGRCRKWSRRYKGR